MSIRPVDFNGMIQRTQDVGNLKQNEDSRPAVQQQNIEIKQEKQEATVKAGTIQKRKKSKKAWKRRTEAFVQKRENAVLT